MSTNIDQEHYTLRQLSKMWNISYTTIRRMFSREPGVIKVQSSGTAVKGHKKGYTTWRIPREVAERVYRRSTVEGRP